MPNRTLPDTFPNFIVIGASKCGTSSLYAYLKQHPEIYLPYVKETQFFTFDEIYALGSSSFTAKYYRGAYGHKAIGDITPTYFSHPEIVIPRMKVTYRGALPKLILIMRNPIERAWSHYLHKVRSGEETESFEEALKLEDDRMRRDPLGWWGYVSEGLYSTNLAMWLDAFPREQFQFMLTENLSIDPDAFLKKIYAFLGVDTDYKIEVLQRKNISGAVRSRQVLSFLAKPSLTKALVKQLLPLRYQQKLKTRIIELNTSKTAVPARLLDDQKAMLRDRLLPDVQELERLTGMDLSAWSM